MSYHSPPQAYANHVPRYSPPRQQSGGAEYYDGAYGRDGAPPSKFMAPIESAYRPPDPVRPNVAPAELSLPQSRVYHGTMPTSPRMPVAYHDSTIAPSLQSSHRAPSPGVGYNPRPYSPSYPVPRSPSPAHSLPMYQDERGDHRQYPQDTKLSTPKPVFAEPSHKFVPGSGPSGLLHGQQADYHNDEKKSAAAPSYREDKDEEVWRRLGREMDEKKRDNAWLSRQAAAGGRFKCGAWVVAVGVLAAIGGSVAYVMMRHSPPTAPRALGWANGASEVPTFGHNTTSNSTTAPSNTASIPSNLSTVASNPASTTATTHTTHTHRLRARSISAQVLASHDELD